MSTRVPDRVRSALARMADRLLGRPTRVDQSNLAELVQRHERLDTLAEQIIILDELADLADSNERRAAVSPGEYERAAGWKREYGWNIGGFLAHYRRSSDYNETEIDDLIELAELLIEWARPSSN